MMKGGWAGVLSQASTERFVRGAKLAIPRTPRQKHYSSEELGTLVGWCGGTAVLLLLLLYRVLLVLYSSIS